MDEPAPESRFVSQFTDAACNENVLLGDTRFLTMCWDYGHGLELRLAADGPFDLLDTRLLAGTGLAHELQDALMKCGLIHIL